MDLTGAAGLAGDQLVVAHQGKANELGDRNDLAFALDGRANFMLFDALMAASLATVLGIAMIVKRTDNK